MNPTRSRSQRRLTRERRTMHAMILMYCQDHHHTTGELCLECGALHSYAMGRLDRCPFGEKKPACANCPIHCYKPDMRAQVRRVMRYAGPRMLMRHPMMAILHLLDGLRKAAQR